MYEKRFYREIFNNELIKFNVCVGETDLFIGCNQNLEKLTYKAIIQVRKILNDYININKHFLTSLVPIYDMNNKHKRIDDMLKAGQKADVGPFAAVAGMVAEYVGKRLKEQSEEVFVENGGDIFIDSISDRVVGIYAGDSPLTGKINILLKKERFPIGVCTSSGTVGPSLSFGKADAVVVISKNTALADAVATATCNRIKEKNDVQNAIEWAYNIKDIEGVIAILGDTLGAIGDIELI